MDEEKIKAKLDEVASGLGRGARITGDRLTGWIKKLRDTWPEVEKSFMRFGKAFSASIGIFTKVFREAYHEAGEKEEEEEK